jgi:HlyD family secretion protein
VVLPENNYIEFFVPANQLSQLSYQQELEYQYYGDKAWKKAKINYISQTAEYMPPILYTQDHQDELVFRIRAQPDITQNMILGQPIKIRI